MKKLFSLLILITGLINFNSASQTSFNLIDSSGQPNGSIILNNPYSITNTINIYKTNIVDAYKTNTVYSTNLITSTNILLLTNYVSIPVYVTNIVNLTNSNPSNPSNAPPSLVISSPINNQKYSTPSIINFNVNASDSDGLISKVNFYVNNILTSSDSNSPYSYSVSLNTAGNYNLQAIAIDDKGLSTSRTVTISLTNAIIPPPITNATNIRYVRQGATGNNSGSDWNNAFVNLPSTLVRGYTYYVADGDYGAQTLDDNANGTTLISVKKATIPDHGSNVGWLDSYGDGVAQFGRILFARPPSGNGGYYDFNGYSPTVSRNCGFVIVTTWHQTSIDFTYYDTGNHPYTSWKYIEMDGPGGATDYDSGDSPWLYGIYAHGNSSAFDTSHMLVSHCYLHGITTFFQDNGGNNYMTVEYCEIGDSRENGVDHGNIYWVGSSYGTFRYNRIYNYNVEGLYFGGSTTGWEIYGNVFYDGVDVARGIEFRDPQTQRNTKIYNNTFVNLPLPAVRVMSGAITVGVEIRNNLLINTGFSFESGTSGIALANNITTNTSVFVDFSRKDFRLKFPIAGGTLLATFNNKDIDNNIRGSDGIWDVGAHEYISGVITNIGNTNTNTNTGNTNSSSGSTITNSNVRYVDSASGNDSNDGKTLATAWKNFNLSLGKLSSGDILYCNGSWTNTTSYTCSLPNVTIDGQGNSTIYIKPLSVFGTLMFSGDNLTFKGFNIKSPYSILGEGHSLIGITANNSKIQDINIKDFSPISTYDAVIFYISANNNTISNVNFYNIADRDLFRVWGINNVFTSCVFSNCTNPSAGSGPHADIFQTWWTGAPCWSNVIERCYFVNSSQATFQLKGTPDNVTCHPGEEGYWSVRNNVFNNCKAWPVMSTDNFRFYNNLLYKSGTGQYPLFFIADPCQNRGRYYNNVLVETYCELGTSPSTGNNAFTRTDASWGGTGDFVTTEAACKFVNPAAGNFRLQSGSSLIGKGVNLSADASMTNIDADGNVRPSAGAWDIGPYQF